MKAKVKSVYFNHPSQGNSTNFYLILGPRDKAAPPTSQQINKFPPKRVKNLATPSSIFIFISSSSTGELCFQPIRGNVRRIGRMFPEHVEQSFLDPEYSFVAVGRILPTRSAKKSSPNRRFPEITGKDNLTVFSYSGRVKSPEWRRQLRRADLRQFQIFGHGPIIIYTRLPAGMEPTIRSACSPRTVSA